MPEHTVNLARCTLDDVLALPPVGHRGEYFEQNPPAWKAGDVIVFAVYGDVEVARGIVAGVECVPQGEEWGGWYRTRWGEFREVPA
jgi:hypothetical protein